MEKNKIILIAVVVLVVVLAAMALIFSNSGNSNLNVTANNTAANTTVNVTVNDTNATNQTNSSGNSSVNTDGWKWSGQQQAYVNEFVDANGTLHLQTLKDGVVEELEFRADGSVFRNGKNITAEYHRDFN